MRYKTLEYPTADGEEEEMAKELPVDVITNILSRIPVKDLIRFRCVSKIWFQLLSVDTHFSKLHFDRQTEGPSDNHKEGVVVLSLEKQQLRYAYDYTAFDKAIKFDIPFADQSSTAHYLIYGICNGLICLSNSVTQKYSNVYIWNPLTRDHITIPCPPIPSHRSLSTVFGFGFCKTVDNEYIYKVVRIAWTPDTLESRFESHVSVYTLGSDSWRSVEPLMYNYNISLDNYSRPPLVNGALHWVSSWPSTPIVSFDIENEVFRLLPRPNAVRYNHTYKVKVVEWGGLLSLIIFPDPYAIEIWSMNEYGVVESWIKQFQCRPGSWTYWKVCLASNDKIVARKDHSELVLLKPDPFSISTLKRFEVEFHSMFSYKGSLISPKNYQWSHSHESGAKRKRAEDGDEEHV